MGRDSGYLPIQTIGEISNDSIDFWLTVTDTVSFYESVFYRIDDQETFNKLVNFNYDDVNFNFQEYTLLMGYFLKFTGPSRISEQSVRLQCGYYDQSAFYEVIVEIVKDEASFTVIQYNAIVPKLPEGIRIGNSVYINELDTIPN